VKNIESAEGLSACGLNLMHGVRWNTSELVRAHLYVKKKACVKFPAHHNWCFASNYSQSRQLSLQLCSWITLIFLHSST